MLKLLTMPEGAFTEGKLQYVEPESWKNVGASLVHAVRLIKDHQVETVENITKVKTFLDQFAKRVLIQVKKVSDDAGEAQQKLQSQLKSNDTDTKEKIRGVESNIQSRLDLVIQSINAQVADMEERVKQSEEKVSKVDTTEVVLG